MKEMIFLRRLCALVFVSAFCASCAPYPPDYPIGGGGEFIPNAEKVDAAQNTTPTIFQLKIDQQLEENRRRLAAKEKRATEASRNTQAEEKSITDPEITKKTTSPTKSKPKYPTALRTREGFVKNPYTGAELDVRGMPSGSLVYDPDDPNKATNRFLIP